MAKPVTVYYNSQVVIAYMKHLKYHGSTMHMDIKNNFVRNITASKEMILQYISTHLMQLIHLQNQYQGMCLKHIWS